jgi:ATP-dependent DNA helicase RecG
MHPDEKENIMNRFKNGDINILVSTTVIEVGIDVPNAGIIVIHHAERFGLSQLHQLRGRVGRGEHQSFCVLVYPDDISQESKNRIEKLLLINDGFEIAEEDLKLRGAGDIIGTRQHGHDSGFEFASLSTDLDLIISAKDEAFTLVSKLKDIHNIFEELEKKMAVSSLLNGIRTKRILSLLS